MTGLERDGPREARSARIKRDEVCADSSEARSAPIKRVTGKERGVPPGVRVAGVAWVCVVWVVRVGPRGFTWVFVGIDGLWSGG